MTDSAINFPAIEILLHAPNCTVVFFFFLVSNFNWSYIFTMHAKE